MKDLHALASLPGEQVESLVAVLDAVRTDAATTRPEVAQLTGLGRNVVTQRVKQLVAVLGATSIEVALADLAGNLQHHHVEAADVTEGPEPVLTRVAELFDEIVDVLPKGTEVGGVGLGLPGPVEFETGTPVSPPIMPGWDGYDVRGFFGSRFRAPVWVDNDVNVMALGELRGGLAEGHHDVVLIKVGSGIGAGLVSRGALHRGAQGCAGDIGHVAVGESTIPCRCGQLGCLEAHAGGFALARDGDALARSRKSEMLAQVIDEGRQVTAETVIQAALRGDLAARELVSNSGRQVGEALARIVNFFNPSLILVGGGVAASGEMYMTELRRSVFNRSLPLATRALQIVQSRPSDHAGLRGAAFMVVDELLSVEGLAAQPLARLS